MKVKPNLLRRVMEKYNLDGAALAREMEVELPEVEKLLSGERVGYDTAKNFIAYLGADEAQALIDWGALGKKNPLACEADAQYADDSEGGTDENV